MSKWHNLIERVHDGTVDYRARAGRGGAAGDVTPAVAAMCSCWSIATPRGTVYATGRLGVHCRLLGPAFVSARAVHTCALRSGPVLKFKKCRFQAHIADVTAHADVAGALSAVVASDKKIAKATHSAIAAWRLEPESDVPGAEALGGYDDCGESGAGKRLLQLLEARGDTNTLVAVTRWYGGRPLGGARFRQITKAANELLAERDDDRAG